MTDANDAVPPESEATDDLSARQRRFCSEYLVDFNGSAAAVRAGYSVLSAKQQASRLLAHPKIKANIDTALEQLRLDSGVKAADVAARLKRIAWSEPSETWRGTDILKALELLGKHLAMFAPETTTKVEVTDPGESAVQRLQAIMARLAALRTPETTAVQAPVPPPPAEPSPAPAAEPARVEPEQAVTEEPSVPQDAADATALPAAKATVVRMRAPQNGSNLFILGDTHLVPDSNRLVWVPADRVELASQYGFRAVS